MMDSYSINLPLLKGHIGSILIHGPADPLVIGHGGTAPMISVTVLAGPVIRVDTSAAPPLGPRVSRLRMPEGVALLNVLVRTLLGVVVALS